MSFISFLIPLIFFIFGAPEIKDLPPADISLNNAKDKNLITGGYPPDAKDKNLIT
jgi:hypothetical protein